MISPRSTTRFTFWCALALTTLLGAGLGGCGSPSAPSPTNNNNQSGSGSNTLAPPTGLTATAMNGDQIQLSWVNSTTGLSSNDIYSSTDGTNFTLVTNALGNSTVQVFTSADPGKTYYFYILADNNGTTSSPSTTVNVTTTGTASGLYAASTNGPAAPTGLAFAKVNSTTWKLTWTNAATYQTIFIFASSTGTIFTQIGTASSGTTTSIDLSNLVSGTKYYFQIQAQDSSNNYSAGSNVVTATP